MNPPRTKNDAREYRFTGNEPHEPNAAVRMKCRRWPKGAIGTALKLTDAKVQKALDAAAEEERQGF